MVEVALNLLGFGQGQALPRQFNLPMNTIWVGVSPALTIQFTDEYHLGRGEGRTLSLLPAKMMAHSFSFLLNTLIGDGAINGRHFLVYKGSALDGSTC